MRTVYFSQAAQHDNLLLISWHTAATFTPWFPQHPIRHMLSTPDIYCDSVMFSCCKVAYALCTHAKPFPSVT
jgi:hypothetical protein